MNYAIILAGGTGQRMNRNGMPKQFLELYGKPIIIYTLEVFQESELVDEIIIPCNQEWIDHLKQLIAKYQIHKVKYIVPGGIDRTHSVQIGLNVIADILTDQDFVMIHDGVRPLIQQSTIRKNIETARQFGNAMTVHPNIETVVVTDENYAQIEDFKNRDVTYTLTAPQTFRAKELIETLTEFSNLHIQSSVPLLDLSMVYASMGKEVYLVRESGNNLKITTPEDYFYLKAYLESQESKHIWGV